MTWRGDPGLGKDRMGALSPTGGRVGTMMSEPRHLQDEIDTFRKEIRSESYPMSIGELMNLYDSEELDLHPEFQRFFRWTPVQKTRLIESILLGIPLPAVFLVQREDGVLDVIDGLQRLSTIFEFTGVLRDESHSVVAPSLVLGATKYLPSLDGIRWDAADDSGPVLATAQRLQFKRSKINLIILERLSDPDAKYELFQRLNTGGSELSDQEVRNCVLIMVNREFYAWLAGLVDLSDFRDVITLSERKEQERYDLELVVRFVVMDWLVARGQGITGLRDLGDFLTEQIVELAKDSSYPRDHVGERFGRTLSIINEALGFEAFLPYKAERDTFGGAFSVAAFEAITFGVSQNLRAWDQLPKDERAPLLRGKVTSMWQDQDRWRSQTGTGVRAENRLPFVLQYAPAHYSP